MKILLIAATTMESHKVRDAIGLPLLETGDLAVGTLGGLEINLLHTGIGMVNTAWHLGKLLPHLRPDLAVQFGVAGSFPGGPGLIEVVEIVQDCFAELGADSPTGFLPLSQMGFANFRHKSIDYFNQVSQPQVPIGQLRPCRAITVNRVSGTAAGIAEMQQIWNPEVETMEGAAFFQACILEEVPFRALRAVSNPVEPRNRAAWKMQEAAAAVQDFLISFLGEIDQTARLQ